jgi:hypothetical protein
MGLSTWAKRKLEDNWSASLSEAIMKMEGFSDMGRGSRRTTSSFTRNNAMKWNGTEGKTLKRGKAQTNPRLRVSKGNFIKKGVFFKAGQPKGDVGGKPKGTCFNCNKVGLYSNASIWKSDC